MEEDIPASSSSSVVNRLSDIERGSTQSSTDAVDVTNETYDMKPDTEAAVRECAVVDHAVVVPTSSAYDMTPVSMGVYDEDLSGTRSDTDNSVVTSDSNNVVPVRLPWKRKCLGVILVSALICFVTAMAIGVSLNFKARGDGTTPSEPTYFPTYSPMMYNPTDSPTTSSMPTFDYDDPQAWNHGTYASSSKSGTITIEIPKHAQVGDTLFLFISRTDAYMPINLEGWTRGASCFKKSNGQPTCFLARECVEEYGTNCLFFQQGVYGNKGDGADLGTILFHRTITVDDPTSWNIELGYTNRRIWAIITAVTNVNQADPIRSAAGTSCDEVYESKFPSVDGEENDVLLLSQAFDDTASREDFWAPQGTFLLGRTITKDEFGILFGEELQVSGFTGNFITRGQGGSECKDALLSIVVSRTVS